MPVAHPEQAAIVSSPRIFTGLTEPPAHGETPDDLEADRRTIEAAKAQGGFVAKIDGKEQVLPT